MKLGITQIKYTDINIFNIESFTYRDWRVMDDISKLAVVTAHRIIDCVEGAAIPSARVGVVIATNTGPINSVMEYNEILKSKGYIGINPSKFPNIMLSTCLSRVATEIKATGPTVPFYISKSKRQPLDYAAVQILKDRCDSAIILYLHEGKGCFGLFLERQDMALNRGLDIRFAYEYKAAGI